MSTRDNQNFSKQYRNILFLLVGLILFFIPLSAIASSRSVEIYGHIRDKDSRDDIRSARIDIFYDDESSPFASAYSDRDGRFRIEVVTNDDIDKIEVYKNGYELERENISDGDESNINVGTIYMEEGSSRDAAKYDLYGKFVEEDDNDREIKDVKITIENQYGDDYTERTDSHGKFRFNDIPVGNYSFKAEKYGFDDYERSRDIYLRDQNKDLGEIEMDYDGHHSSSSDDGDGDVFGKVKDEDGYYVQDAEVYLIDDDDEYKVIKDRTDSRGAYKFDDVDEGTYTIGVSKSGFDLLERINYVRVRDNRENEVSTLVISEEDRNGEEVSGQVVDRHNDGIKDAEVYLVDGNTRIKRVYTDSDGDYEFRHVTRGTYDIEVRKLGYKTKKARNEVEVRYNSEEVSDIELDEAEAETDVDGGLVGDTQSGLRNIRVYLENNDESYHVNTNYYGYFTFRNVKEGIYDVYAQYDGKKRLLEEDVRVKGKKVEIGDMNVNRSSSGYKIYGNVEDRDNRDLRDADIRITGEGKTKTTTTNSKGYYEIDGLERGEYKVYATKKGYSEEYESRIEIRSDDKKVNFELEERDYIKVDLKRDISVKEDEKVDLDDFIDEVEIYSSNDRLLDEITRSYDADVEDEYDDYISINSRNEITGKKVGTAYIKIDVDSGSRRNSNVTAARIKVEVKKGSSSSNGSSNSSGNKVKTVVTVGSNIYNYNGQALTADATPYIKDSRSFFPLRVLAKALEVGDKDIKWDALTQTATLIKGSNKVEFIVGQKYYRHNGVTMYMDVAPENTTGRLFLPAKYVADAFGGKLQWNNFTKSLTIELE